MPRLPILLLFVALTSVSFAQDPDPDRPPAGAGDDIKKARADEIAKFHPKVKGMDGATWLKGYGKRKKMEAESPFSQIKWRSVGPEVQSGRVVDIESPIGQPGSLYLGFATGGLWRSTDGGNNFSSLFDGYSSCGIGDFALSRDGKTIWVGTGENNSQRTSYAGTGVFKSTDSGATWQYMGLPESQHIGRILIDPRNENTVYVGVLGHLYSQNPERGVYKTTDGGKTWQWMLKLDDQTGVIDMAMDPRNPDVIYASAWDRDRRAWNFRESGPGSGVYKTVDAGKTWKLQTDLPHAEEAGRIGIDFSKSNPNRIYVYVDNHGLDHDWADADEKVPSGVLTPRRFTLLTSETFLAIDKKVLDRFFTQYAPKDLKLDDVLAKVKDKKMTMEQVVEEFTDDGKGFKPGVVESEMIRSNDGGKTWKRTESGAVGGNSYYYFGNVIVNPKDPDDVFGTGTQLMRSRDGGRSWRIAARPAHVDFHAVWFDPNNVKHIIVGCDGGAYETFDDGVRWRHLNNLAVGQATTVAVDNKSPYNIYVGLQDNGTMKGPSNYRPGTSDLSQWTDVGGGDGAMVAVDPRRDGDVIYTGSQFGAEGATDQKSKERWSVTPRVGGPNRFNWVSPIFLSPFNPDTVYFGGQKLFKSTDQGRKYEAISPDLTKNKPQGNVPYDTIKDISESPLKEGVIYVGCDDGNVQMTLDGGKNWNPIPTPQPDKWVSRVVASKYEAGTVYCSQSGYREDDFAPYLWKSTDYGKTWVSITGDLPTETINVVREDPDHKELLYVGTDMGVFVSYNGGVHWDTLQGGLPNVPVHDIAIQAREHDLVIATHARSAWVLPLKLVYDLTPEIRSKDLTLFAIDDMRRDRNWGYANAGGRGGGGIFGEPANPLVHVNFYTKASGKGYVRIKDKTGKVVKEKAIDAATGYNFVDVEVKTAEGGPLPTGKRPVKTVEDVLRDPYEATRPKYLEAGDYTIEVSVGGKTISQAWKLTAPSD